MSVAIDPSDVLERVAFRLHLPTFASGNFVTDAQAVMLLKDACERLSALVLKAYGSNYFARQSSVNTQAGVDIVSLPTGLATIEGVYWLTGDRAVQLEHAYRLDEDLAPRAWDAPDLYAPGLSTAPTYRVEGNVLVLRPVPNAVYSIRIDYQTTPTIASISDTIYGQAGWREWLVLDLCEVIADREDKDPSRFTARKAKVEADIKMQAADRDRGTRPQVVDAYGALQRSRLDWRFRGVR